MEIDYTNYIRGVADRIYARMVSEWTLSMPVSTDLTKKTEVMQEFAVISLLAAEVFVNEARKRLAR